MTKAKRGKQSAKQQARKVKKQAAKSGTTLFPGRRIHVVLLLIK